MDDSKIVDYDRLYDLRDPFSNRFFRGSVSSPPEVDPNGLLTGDAQPSAPFRVRRSEGGLLTDIVWTTHVAVVLMSERLANALSAQPFFGWSTYPVNLEADDGKLHNYFGITVTGRCGPVDRTRGEWVRKDDEPGRFLRGLFFDEQSWDGSDFFLPEGTVRIFLTERVRDWLKRERVRNVRCTRLSDALTAEVVIRNTRSATAQP